MYKKPISTGKYAKKSTRYKLPILFLSVIFSCLTTIAHASNFRIGTGIYDITGAAAETGMFGYAAHQETDGLHQRLYARAFIIKQINSKPSQRVVIVNCDLGMMPQSVKLEVVRRLSQKYGPALYTHANVMLTATHTHVGSGSISHYPLYKIAAADSSGFGYDRVAYEVTVDGIVNAISRAHDNLAPGTVELAQGDLPGATRNRSIPAYTANREANSYPHNVNQRMVQLKFTKTDGKSETEIGLLNWFAIHNTSFSMKFTKISGDNKGYAQWRFEKDKGSDISKAETFVAAFANSDEGDVVPTDGNAVSMPGYEGSSDEYANAEAAGRRQYDKAVELYQGTQIRLRDTVDFRHQWINMENYTVSPTYTGAGAQKLCKAALGTSFAAGGENGPSNVPGVYEGMTFGNHDRVSVFTGIHRFGSGFINMLTKFLNLAQYDKCQLPKPVLLGTGSLGMVPNVLPFQVFTVGKLAIVGLPFEVTTMAGRRIRDRVLSTMPGKVDTVVITGLANSYAGYLSTKEEFDKQHYEGASTQFGPYQLAATEQILYEMSQALVQGTPVRDTGVPTARTPGATRVGVVYDNKPPRQKFGQLLLAANNSYSTDDTVTVQFRSGHPKNNLRTQDTFLLVERLGEDGNWVKVADDADWNTVYQWDRVLIAQSTVTISWKIPADATPGTYRIRHFGDWKNGWNQSINAYEGESNTFTVARR